MRTRSRLPLLTVGLVVALHAAPGYAQDADGDGVPNAIDVFPCDASASAVTYIPAESAPGLLLFEDEWPRAGDLDFNDVVLAHHTVLRQNAAGQVVSLRLTLDALAIGGLYRNGLGLQLPVARAAVASVTRAVGGGASEGLEVSLDDASLTVILSADLRELFGDDAELVNSLSSRPRQSGARLVVEIAFTSPQLLASGAAPWDLFIFRTHDRGHQIHRPEYAGTSGMNAALFGTASDASTPGRAFVDGDGLPFAIALPALASYPREGVSLHALFPQVIDFARSGGTSDTGFYNHPVASAAYVDSAGLGPVAPPAIPALQIDVSCVPAIGSAQALAGQSCRAIRDAGGSNGSGVYWIDPNGGSTADAYQAYCDMVTDGGGWTLVVNFIGGDIPNVIGSTLMSNFMAPPATAQTIGNVSTEIRFNCQRANSSSVIDVAATNTLWTRRAWALGDGCTEGYNWAPARSNLRALATNNYTGRAVSAVSCCCRPSHRLAYYPIGYHSQDWFIDDLYYAGIGNGSCAGGSGQYMRIFYR